MNKELLQEKLNNLFRELLELREEVDCPAMEASLRMMLVYCHMSRWQIGATDFTDSEWEIACLQKESKI